MSGSAVARSRRLDVTSSLGNRVYEAFRQEIVTGQFRPGEALSESFLAKRYSASRTPVREAAVRLQQDGLLQIIRNRGYFVTQITVAGLNEIYEYRCTVETAAAEFAAQKSAYPELAERLRELAHIDYRTDDRNSYVRFIGADTEFHTGIARLSRNPWLVRAVTEMRLHMERIMHAAIDIGYYGEFPIQEHCNILEAIEQHDAPRARRLMYEHISGSKERVVRIAGNSPRL